jgi:hypothetical protein
MARPLRIEFAGGLYHVTSRGNARQHIYSDNRDRAKFLDLIDKTRTRFDWYIHAYCLMSNHYHLLIETGTPTLGKSGDSIPIYSYSGDSLQNRYTVPGIHMGKKVGRINFATGEQTDS